MANKVKEAWKAGRAVVNGWLAIPNAFSAEMFAQAGWDSVTVDMQHGVQDYLSLVACFQGMQPHGVLPMVRVPWNEPGIIGKVLDAGAYGVICPMVNTEAEARALVQYSQVPAEGHPLQRPDPRRALRRGRHLPGHRQRRRPRHPDDRDAAGARQPRSHPGRAGASTRSISAPPTSASPSAWRRSSTGTSRRS